MAGKMAASAVVVIMAMMGYLTTYQSDAEAQAYQQQHGQELQAARIEQIEALISQYQFQKIKAATEEEKEWLTDEIQRLKEKIACIRRGEC